MSDDVPCAICGLRAFWFFVHRLQDGMPPGRGLTLCLEHGSFARTTVVRLGEVVEVTREEFLVSAVLER